MKLVKISNGLTVLNFNIYQTDIIEEIITKVSLEFRKSNKIMPIVLKKSQTHGLTIQSN